MAPSSPTPGANASIAGAGSEPPHAADVRRAGTATAPPVIGGTAVAGTPSQLGSPADPDDTISFASATPELVAEAAELGEATRFACAALSRADRARILRRIADQVDADSEVLAEVITREAGKALCDSVGEVARCSATLRTAADAVNTLAGREIPVDGVSSGDGRAAYTTWEPVGVVAAICGFNFPLLLATHKVAAAIGAGCPVLVKPSDRTPLTAVVLARYIVESGWPASAISVLPGGPDIGEALVAHPLVRLVSFTGSSHVGARIAAAAGGALKRCVMELGSNTATIVAADADLSLAAAKIASGAMTSSGQSCISVQRVFAHRSIASDLSTLVATRVAAMRTGDPYDPDTEIGQLISREARDRIAELVDDAVDAGAELLTGGTTGGSLQPTVLLDPPPHARISQEEAFGPVLAIYPFDELEDAIAAANDTDYGLMAGVFTASLETAFAVARKLQTGGVHINDSSNFRADNMPYGGVKQSGFGKEGPESAIREMSVEKVLTLRLPA